MLSNIEVHNRFKGLEITEHDEDQEDTVKIPFGPPPGLTRRTTKVRFVSPDCKASCCNIPSTTTWKVPVSEVLVGKKSQGERKKEHKKTIEINSIDANRNIAITIYSGAAETVTGKYIHISRV